MKLNRFIFASLLVMASTTQAQELKPVPGVFVTEHGTPITSDGLRELIIWQEDFSNGIPATWENSATPSPAAWEYRGPATNPSNAIGTRGSCITNGTDGGPAIQSPSADNGFVIFDSNYWDDNVGPCGNFGAGEAPGPHYATLTSPVIDLSGFDQVGLRFNQFCKNYQAETRVEYSLSGGAWEVLWVNDVPLNSGISDQNRFDRINVSETLAGQSSVRIRFVFDGNYYYWMIDDVEFFEMETNNLIIDTASYGDFNPDDQGHETGFEFMEYSQYPVEMSPEVYFNVNAYNWGAEAQTGARLEGVLRNEATLDTIYEATTNPISLNPDSQHEFRATPTQQALEIGNYTAHFRLMQNESDDSPDNNHTVLPFEVTDVTYSRDRLAMDALFVADEAYFDSPFEMGNFFVITAENQACHSISLSVGPGTDPFAPMYGAIYKMKLDGGIVATEIANTGIFGVTAEAYCTSGENNFMTVPFPEPVSLDKDSLYLIVAGCTSGPENVYIAMSGNSEPFTSMVRFYPNSWFYSLRTPMVKANFGPVVGVEDVDSPAPLLSCYPNPANDEVRIRLQANNTALTVTDITGKIVHKATLRYSNPMAQLTLKTAQWAPGMYVVSAVTDGKAVQQQLMITH